VQTWKLFGPLLTGGRYAVYLNSKWRLVMQKTKKIASIADFLKLLPPPSDKRYYFRGSSDAKYKLTPKLLREDNLVNLSRCHSIRDITELQQALLDRFFRYVPEYGARLAYMDASGLFGPRLCVAQHHGLPTLLLDWTLNPLTALYFSTSNPCISGCIWVMELRPKRERKDLTVHLESGDDICTDLKSPVIVVPRPWTQRVSAQAGRFTYSTKSLGKYRTKNVPWSKLTKYPISKKTKGSLRKELQRVQIHEGTMFPDLDGYARYLSEGGL